MTLDPFWTSTYMLVIAVACITTLCTLIGADALLLYSGVKFYRRFPRRKQHIILSCIPSTIHALVVSPLAVYILLADDELYTDLVWGNSTMASMACSITIGYIISDSLYILIRWKHIGSWQFVFHHSITLAAYGYVVKSGTFRYFAMIRLLAEFSTPCVNLRLVLHELNMQGGAAYFYNGLLMVASFTCARILPLPYYIYKIYSVHNTESLEASGFGKYMLWLSTIILDTLNIIWYHRMINGALKILNSPKVPDTPQVTERLKQG